MTDWYIRDGRLHGIVTGHPTLEDGTTIATSEIVDINFDLKQVYTQNTCYALERIHPRYYEYANRPAELAMMEQLMGRVKGMGGH